ncbi:MAG: tetratricopeptide repeat protein [Leeuwenhoekiella sp.]
MKILRYLFLTVSLTLAATQISAQEETVTGEVNVDDLGNVTDEFQESFFEALKQKGIENYDRAIIALDRCIELQPNEAILYFEKGKNLALSGDSEGAAINYRKALEIKPNQQDILESLYEVYYAQQDFDKAIEVVKQLSQFDYQYQEDLARIYVRTKEFEKALSILDDMDKKLGKDSYRDQIRQQAFALSDGDLKEKTIQQQINADPDSEQNYLNLIYVYSEEGETQKAYETAQKLLKINPKAEIVHLALYKFYLEKGNIDEAVNSMEIVFKSKTIDAKAKHTILNDFLIYVDKNSEYQPELENAILLFSQEENIDVNEELGDYYLKQSDKTKALEYFEEAYKNNTQDNKVLQNLMVLRLDNRKFKETETLGLEAIELYPAQPLFYLILGVSQINLEEYNKAIDNLEAGVDYIIDDVKMESDFYSQLAIAYEKSGDATKAAVYRKKASALTQ